jgi:hypothetical protein
VVAASTEGFQLGFNAFREDDDAHLEPQCLLQFGYQGAIFPDQHVINHSFLYAETVPGGNAQVMSGGPTITNPITWSAGPGGIPVPTYTGFGLLKTEVSAQGMYKEASNAGSSSIWAEYQPCSTIATLIRSTRALNDVYTYGGLTSNSNSLISTLLASVGLLGIVPQPPLASGWGERLVP